MISVIIPAAGQGRRMGLGYNKVLAQLQGEPIYITTIKRFLAHPLISEIILVVEKENIDSYCAKVQEIFPEDKITVVAGGAERQASVYNGLQAVSTEAKVVLIHDGARPLVNKQVIDNVLAGVKNSGAAICAVPVKDTIAVMGANNYLQEVPDRSLMWAVQTPQGFTKDLILKAHEWAKDHDFLGTDDSSLVKAIGEQVEIVEGSYENIKITTKSDLLFAANILAQEK